MYRNFNFGEPNEPFGYHDIHIEERKNEARSVFSRCHLGLFFFYLITQSIAILVQIILAVALTPEVFVALSSNVYYTWLLNYIPMYLFAFPALYLIIKGVGTREREKKNMGVIEFIFTFLVCQAAISLGNSIGTTIVTSLEYLTGRSIGSTAITLVEESPLWLVFVFSVVVAPIAEEFIFRKLLIDRFSKYGDFLAITVSAISFGLFHGNLTQFFYATLLGLIFGYVYTKTGKVIYSMALHMLVNFFGGFVARIFLDIQSYIEEATLALESGLEIDISKYTRALMATGSYGAIQFAMIASGMLVFFLSLIRRKITLEKSREHHLPLRHGYHAAAFNVGSILYLALSFVTITLSTFIL